MVLRQKPGVSFSVSTVENVYRAAEKLGYPISVKQPHSSKLFGQKTVLIISPNVLNPYYATMIQAIEQEAYRNHYHTLVYSTYRDLMNERKILDLFSNSDIGGIIFTMMPQAIELVERINTKIPTVVIGDRNSNVNIDTVEMNNYNAGILIAQHMIDLGHKHIAYISTTLNESNSARTRRLDGVLDTYKLNCPDGSVLIKSRDISPEADLNNPFIELAVGSDLTSECLDNKKITAFVAVNDMVAYGVMDALQKRGFHIPRDYSVCGFDNIFPSQFPAIGLTTVEHYITDKGRNAFEILCRKMEHSTSRMNITRIEYQHHLIIRDSTAPARITK